MKFKKIIPLVLLLLMIMKFSYYGFSYFPIVDDNNQYGIYNLRSNNDTIYNGIITHYRSYNVRPFAFFTDVYLISPFWNNMYVILIIMTLLNFLSAHMFKKIMDRYKIPFGYIGIIIFTLAPFLFQATYWISASSRLVISLFFCISSMYLFLYAHDNKNEKFKYSISIIEAIALNILSVGFYEQTIAFNLFFSLFVIVKEKKYKFTLIPIISTVIIGVYYIISIINGSMPNRGNIETINLFEHISKTFNLISTYFFNTQFEFTYSGFKTGFQIIMQNLNFLPILGLIAILIFSLYKSFDSTKKNFKKNISGIIIGIFLFFIPLIPFFILQNTVLAERNFYIPYLGFILILVNIFYLLLSLIKNIKVQKIIECSITFILVLMFMITNTAILQNYKNVYEFDNFAVNQILQKVDKKVFENKETLYINYNKSLLENKNITKAECASVIESDWALMGKIQVLRNSTNIGNIILFRKPESKNENYYFIDE